MQILSGQAKVLSANLRRIQFTSMTVEDAALLASGQVFKFADESLLWFTVASVITSSQPTPEIELVNPYNGLRTPDVLYAYLLAKDFTPVRGLYELSYGDIDIRDAITQSMRIIDPLLGAGGGGSGFTASGVATVASGAVTKTVTGTFPAGGTYGVHVSTNWGTGWWWVAGSKTTTQFVVGFNTPAPTSGAEINWGVV